MRLLLTLPLILSCAAGSIPNGPRGIAFGQAEISRCVTRGEETICEKIGGGALSPEGAKIVGPISGLVQFLVGLL